MGCFSPTCMFKYLSYYIGTENSMFKFFNSVMVIAKDLKCMVSMFYIIPILFVMHH